MKNWLLYLAGLATGVVLTFIVFLIIGLNMQKEQNNEEVTNEQVDNGTTMFDEPGDIIEGNEFKVIQVAAKNAALVNGQKKNDDMGLFLGTTCLITNHQGKYYYDDEVIKVPKDKVVRQVGIYKYQTRMGLVKTVPIIEIMDK